MTYRTLGRTGMQVSEIGLGSEGFMNNTEEHAKALIDAALDWGINYFDMYNSEPDVRSNFGKAMAGRREKFIIQGQIGSTWQDGQYKRSRELPQVKAAFEDLLERMGTDYMDVGMIHFVDEQEDFDRIFGGEFLQYVLRLKEEGKIRCTGLGTHNQLIALQAAQSGLIDVIMLSINPAYDMVPPSEDLNVLFEEQTYTGDNSALANIDPDREKLYQYCEANGVALTVMKPFAGGALLDERQSPFGVAMTVPQCLHYCLTRPAVASVLAGAKTPEEVADAARYCSRSEEEKDYAKVLSAAPAHRFSDKCMYCGHCAPCTVAIDIATVNKYADLCEAQGMVPETVRDHYELLKAKASDCVQCGICETNCPFGVKIMEHMEKAVRIFGK